MSELHDLLARLWRDYAAINPQAATIHALLSAEGAAVVNDHIALRTFGDPRVGIDVLARPFVRAGYRVAGAYRFREKRLIARHFAHDDPTLPLVFVSELVLAECSNELQDMVERMLAQVPAALLASPELPAAGPLVLDPRDMRIAELEQEAAGLWTRVEELERERAEQAAEQQRREARLQTRVEQLEQECAKQATELAALREENQALKTRLGQTSRNSNRPPSSDPEPVKKKKRPHSKPSGRPRGGQPGHPKHEQNLVPPELVQEVHECKPTHCKHCHTELCGEDPDPECRQRIELPKIVPEVQEYRLHALPCPHCGQVTRAAFPEELGHGAYGPRLLALVGLLTGVYRMTKRQAQSLLSEVFGVEMSLGMVSKCERRLSLALLEPVRAVGAAICEAPLVNIDETGWFQEGQHFWLWSASTPTLAYFCVADSRGAEVAETILGPDFGGIVTSDRLSSYSYIAPEQRQVCWAHLDRNFAALIEGGGPGARLGQALKNLSARLFRAWHQFCAGKRTRVSLQTYARKLRKQVHAVLAEFAAKTIPKASRFAQNLLDIEPALWTFVEHPGVEPTNNAAERALRPGVIHRKISFGTRSPRGSLFVARMLSAAETLHRQARRAYSFLVELLDCHPTGRPLPSLLPP